jgi:hypothetical protein
MLNLIFTIFTVLVVVAFAIFMVSRPNKSLLKFSVPIFTISFVALFIAIIYFESYSIQEENQYAISAVVLRSLFLAFETFLGNAFDPQIEQGTFAYDLFNNSIFQFGYWAVHIIVMVSLLTTMVAIFGKSLLSKLRLSYNLHKNPKRLHHIFGTGDDVLKLAQNIQLENKKNIPVIYSSDFSEDTIEEILLVNGVFIEVAKSLEDKAIEKATKYSGIDNISVFSGTAVRKINGIRECKLIAKQYYKNSNFENIAIDGDLKILLIGFGDIGCAILTEISKYYKNQVEITVIDIDHIQFEEFEVLNPSVPKNIKINFIESNFYSKEFAIKFEKMINVGKLNVVINALLDTGADGDNTANIELFEECNDICNFLLEKNNKSVHMLPVDPDIIYNSELL